MYFNTTNERGQQLNDSRLKVATQNEIVLTYFKAHKARFLSPSDVWQNCFNGSVPLTSVRRAITNLERSGMLKKTDVKIPGIYGKDTYTWVLA